MSSKGSVAQVLATLGARTWQIEIAGPILEAALLETEPLVEPVIEGEEAASESM
jgi:hypothetical protein